MGIAVLTVVYGHLLYYHAGLINYESNHWTEWYTLESVEIFMFLSGFSIYHSLLRNNALLPFYQKRFSRLIPSYVPVILIWSFFQIISTPRMRLGELVSNVTAIGWWFNQTRQFNWYVPTIVVLYLLSPLFFELIQKDRKKSLWVFAAIVVLNISAWRTNLLLGLSRFFTFYMGMYFGMMHCDKQEIPKSHVIGWYIIGIVAMAVVPYYFLVKTNTLWYYGMYWNLFVISTPAWMFALTKLLELQEKILPGQLLNKFWKFLGESSFEIFLCHLCLYSIILKYDLFHSWAAWICIAITGTAIGLAFNRLVNFLMKKRAASKAGKA